MDGRREDKREYHILPRPSNPSFLGLLAPGPPTASSMVTGLDQLPGILDCDL